MKSIIQKKKENLRECQVRIFHNLSFFFMLICVQCPPTRPGLSYYNHHIVCHAEQEVEPRREYEMTKPHETICTSRAPKTRLIGSLEEYRAMLAEKKIDWKQTKEIEKLFCEIKENENCSEGILKMPHTSRQIYNMILLEKMLQSYPESQEDCHTKAHRNFENE